MSTNTIVTTLVWFAFGVHVVAGIIGRRPGGLPVVAGVNLLSAACVLSYWVVQWYSYLVRGIKWYATDQLVPLYALVVLLAALLTLTGRYQASWPTWVFFAIDTAVLVAAVLYFSFVRFDRLI
jgi:hypothetical protein